MKIIIVKKRIGWRVQIGESWSSGLGSDEALFVVATAMISNSVHHFLRSTTGWRTWRRTLRAHRADATNNG